MSENKKAPAESASKTTDLAISKKKTPRKIAKKHTAIAKPRPRELEQAMDETFERFRDDMESLFFPLPDVLTNVPESRVPAIDLEDREKDFLLKAEMPGFKKGDIEINVRDDGVEITGTSGWKYDKKDKDYICKERECKTFYRYVDLPEEVKIDEVNANLCDGVLEITLPKKAPKPRRKIQPK
jgi:HSP20 family protein